MRICRILATATATAMAAALSFSAGTALAATEIVVGYPYAALFAEPFNIIKKEFEAENPGITVKFEPPYIDYEDATQRVLRQALTDQLPDVSFQGINRLRVFVERNLAQPLDSHMAGDSDWASHGVPVAMQDVGLSGGKHYGIPFALSTPVVMFNKDLVKEAGGDPENFPKTWDGVNALSKKIDALGDKIYGNFFAWQITGNWMWQALITSQCGKILDSTERKVKFNDVTGLRALTLLRSMVDEGNMPDLAIGDAYTSMYAGTLGMLISSVAGLGGIERKAEGKFAVGAAVFPEVKPDCGRVPGGGNLGLVFTKDEERQKAAWKFIKHTVSASGQTHQAGHTGYMPTNSKVLDDDRYLKKFYQENPSHRTTLQQMDYVTTWYAFPGENALKITDVIKNHLQSVVNKSATPEAALKNMATDVTNLLPE
jgi:multiple sugar transport system substrate-binding protein